MPRVSRSQLWNKPGTDRTGEISGVAREEPVAEVETTERETLAPELERVTWLGLQKLEQILRLPTRVTVTC
jgi:hypothetical protein